MGSNSHRCCPVLGVHAMGESAAEIVRIGQAVISFGGTMDYFRDTVFNYPTLQSSRLGWVEQTVDDAISAKEGLTLRSPPTAIPLVNTSTRLDEFIFIEI